MMWEISPWQVFVLGGPLMWPILLCSVFAAAITIEKVVFFNGLNEDVSGLKDRIFTSIRRNDIKAALEACDRSGSPTASVLKAGLLQYGRGIEDVKAAMEGASRFEVPRLEERLPALYSIGNIVPLLGFLGTVTGMGSSFHRIQMRALAMNPVMPGDVAAGIWEALITTGAGLVVMISAFLAYSYLLGCQDKHVLEMEKTAMDLVDFLVLSGDRGDTDDKATGELPQAS